MTVLEQAVEEIMMEVDGHLLAGSSVSRRDTIEFYRTIAQLCGERAALIESELGEEE